MNAAKGAIQPEVTQQSQGTTISGGIPVGLTEPQPVVQIQSWLAARPGTRLATPLIVGWQLTTRCNLRCRHCWTDNRQTGCRASEREIIAHRLARAGLCRVILSGGEASLLPDFGHCLKILKETSTPVGVYTNATALRSLSWLEHWDYAIDHVQVSIDGGSAATFEAQRGKGTFQRLKAGLGRLQAAGVRVVAHYVATPWNNRPGDLRGAAQLAQEYGCESFVAELYHARGRAAGLNRQIAIEVARGMEREARALLEDLERSSSAMSIHVPLSPVTPFPDWYGRTFPPPTGDDLAPAGQQSLPFGTWICFVLADGTVVPTLETIDSVDLAYGSLLEADLEELWVRGGLKTSLPRLRDLRHSPCNGCTDFPWCKGGSLRRVLATGLSPDQPDPWCHRLHGLAATA